MPMIQSSASADSDTPARNFRSRLEKYPACVRHGAKEIGGSPPPRPHDPARAADYHSSTPRFRRPAPLIAFPCCRARACLPSRPPCSAHRFGVSARRFSARLPHRKISAPSQETLPQPLTLTFRSGSIPFPYQEETRPQPLRATSGASAAPSRLSRVPRFRDPSEVASLFPLLPFPCF